MFNGFKTSTKLTSNHHAQNVLYNAIIHCQVRRSKRESESTTKNRISKSSEELKDKIDTLFTFDEIKFYPLFFQSHLERISDYLLEGRVFWEETLLGVRFLDISEVQTTMKKHHFRSSTIKNEIQNLEVCWEKCLRNINELVPAFKIVLEDESLNEDGEKEKISKTYKPTTLKKFRPSEKVTEIESSNTNENQTPPKFSTPLFPEYKRKSSKNPLNVSPIENVMKKSKKAKRSLKCTDEKNLPDPEPIMTKLCLKVPEPSKEPSSEPSSQSSTKTQPPSNQAPHKSYQNKTTKLLASVFGDIPILSEFDRIKTLFKSNQKDYLDSFKDISAQLEVILKNKCSSLRKEKKEFEDKIIKENNFNYKEIKDKSFLNIVNNLKILSAILKNL